MKNNQKGFTLIELLVVIAIIGLLSTLAVVSLNNARAKSRDSKRVADVKQMQTALEMYYNECNGYPLNDGTDRLLISDVYNNGAATCATTFGTFLSQVPAPALPIDNTAVCTAANASYHYTSCNVTGSTCNATPSLTNGASYTISYCLGAVTGGLAAGAHTATPAGM